MGIGCTSPLSNEVGDMYPAAGPLGVGCASPLSKSRYLATGPLGIGSAGTLLSKDKELNEAPPVPKAWGGLQGSEWPRPQRIKGKSRFVDWSPCGCGEGGDHSHDHHQPWNEKPEVAMDGKDLLKMSKRKPTRSGKKTT